MGNLGERSDIRSEPEDTVAPALTLRAVGMTYADASGKPLEVMSGLNLSLATGELVCLAGRSGSGKTTAVMIAAGLLAPTAGMVRWGELDLADLTDDQLARERGPRIGIVFQNAALIPTLRSGENVALAGMIKDGANRGAAQRVEYLLEAVGLADRAKHYPAQLSGGEQQRVALARALYRDPPLLLVDEPTANLDRTTANEIIALLVAVRDGGRALLVATHDEAIATVADSVIEMD